MALTERWQPVVVVTNSIRENEFVGCPRGVSCSTLSQGGILGPQTLGGTEDRRCRCLP